ncbi:hypothetical protein DFQ27_003365 [Actinomortierella ambigua]|uniref:Fe2OG dioxygenase domain-containing protein n=1 Tax=Actinomortierella ambigua TaxID=1343610 RepID=A0A9P6QI49_9FUNG|nr:hypothetical protein DFQ27_003365 [Actinomortierella ambigua]
MASNADSTKPLQKPISNRQRKQLERQAERNRELAAQRQATTRTPFREAELAFLARLPPPDYSKALNFRLPREELLQKNPKVKIVPITKKLDQISPLFGLRSDTATATAAAAGTVNERVEEVVENEWDSSLSEYAYMHDDHPGLIYIPAGFTPSAQKELIRNCLAKYSRHPNKSNLDTHYIVPDEGVWQLHEKVFKGETTLEDPSVFVQKRAKVDDQAAGYGSDDDSDDEDNNNSKDKHGPPDAKKHKESNGQAAPAPKSATEAVSKPSSIRTLVPIIAGSPTVPDGVPKADLGPSATVPILPPSQLFRKMRWITLGYQYHWPSKTYHFDQNAPFPSELCELSKGVVEAIEGIGGYSYPSKDFVAEAGVINYYQLKDRLMGHVDRSELNKTAPLVSFSFGHSCIYLLGGPDRETAPTPILLQSGDILVMTGPCRAAFHGVPRIIEDTLPSYLQKHEQEPGWDICADYLAEARINLNIRQVFPPGQATPSQA